MQSRGEEPENEGNIQRRANQSKRRGENSSEGVINSEEKKKEEGSKPGVKTKKMTKYIGENNEIMKKCLASSGKMAEAAM